MNAQFGFKLSDELLERVKAISDKKGVTLSRLIKDHLLNLCDEDTEKTPYEVLEERVSELEKRMNRLEQK